MTEPVPEGINRQVKVVEIMGANTNRDSAERAGLELSEAIRGDSDLKNMIGDGRVEVFPSEVLSDKDRGIEEKTKLITNKVVEWLGESGENADHEFVLMLTSWGAIEGARVLRQLERDNQVLLEKAGSRLHVVLMAPMGVSGGDMGRPAHDFLQMLMAIGRVTLTQMELGGKRDQLAGVEILQVAPIPGMKIEERGEMFHRLFLSDLKLQEEVGSLPRQEFPGYPAEREIFMNGLPDEERQEIHQLEKDLLGWREMKASLVEQKLRRYTKLMSPLMDTVFAGKDEATQAEIRDKKLGLIDTEEETANRRLSIFFNGFREAIRHTPFGVVQQLATNYGVDVILGVPEHDVVLPLKQAVEAAKKVRGAKVVVIKAHAHTSPRYGGLDLAQLIAYSLGVLTVK